MSKLTDAVLALAEPVAAQQGCEIWDVEYVKEGGDWFLRLYIDKEGGVDINDCEAISRRSRCGSISRWTAARCTSARSSSMTTAT